jgi:acid phosphatase type 7
MKNLFLLLLFSQTVLAQTLVRGPYLQLGTQTAATIRWRTDVPTQGRVQFGLAAGNLAGSVTESASTTEHEVRLTGLTPDRQYFYSIGTPTQILQQGPDNYFLTAPTVDTKRKIRIASFGDCGFAFTNNQADVRNGFLAYRGNTPTDLWMLIGDNSYDGEDSHFQYNFFRPYGDNLLKNSMLFAVPGNHDYSNNPALAASHAIPYFSIFTFPTNAEVGGVPSGTEEWYSFDYGPIHFVMLDGYGTRPVNGVDLRFYADTTNHPQSIWLKQDLAANTKKWTVVYLHFPPYSQGSHNSETEGDLISIRQNINPILERYGVDLVLNGHSHVYERSWPIHDQYGPMADFANNPAAYRYPAHNSTGRYDGSTGSCPYLTTGEKKKQGTVYVVSGSAGAFDPNPTPNTHTVMLKTEKVVGGSFYMEVEDNRLDARFLQNNPPNGPIIGDQFTIMKDVAQTKSVVVSGGQSATLTASYVGNYGWSSPGHSFAATTRSVVVSPTASQTFVVSDGKGCVQDVFVVMVGCDSPIYSLKTGYWTDPSVWSCGRVPTASDVVLLKHPVYIPSYQTVQAHRVIYEPGIKIQFGPTGRLVLGQ